MLGTISSIATLILFVIYFVGRIITMFAVNSICYDILESATHTPSDNLKVVEEISLDNYNENALLLTSVNGIRDIKIYKMKYDKEYTEIIEKREEFYHSFLNIGHTLRIKVTLAECVPMYLLEFVTNDFKKVSLEMTDNLKNGIISEKIKSKHTIKSILYYLFR